MSENFPKVAKTELRMITKFCYRGRWKRKKKREKFDENPNFSW